MYIQRLVLEQFRNHAQRQLEFNAQFNAISGPNGTGKTNLLDALHYVATGRSFFGRNDASAIGFDADFCLIRGQSITDSGRVQEVRVSIGNRSRKSLFLNGVQVRKVSEHYGFIPVVMVTPAEIGLVHGGGRERRKFIDGLIAQTAPDYLKTLIQMHRLLEARMALLKWFRDQNSFDTVALQSYDRSLIPAMDQIHAARIEFVNQFAPLMRDAYATISANRELATLEYESALHGKTAAELLSGCLAADRAAARCTAGCHKDDLHFELEGKSLKTFGSQGQVKSFVIALHLAAYQYLQQKLNRIPLLLLDDIFEKIDHERASRLLQSLGEQGFGQIFLTDTDEERMRRHIDNLSAGKKFFKFERP